MTVIVWKKPSMASDSRVSDDDDSSIFTNKYKKIHQLKNGSLLGIAGDADHRAVVDLFNKVRGNKFPTNKQMIAAGLDFDGLFVPPDMSCWYVSCGKKSKNEEWAAQILQINDPFVAIGSGGKYAAGALDRGATVEQAVKTAIKFDPSCGGAVQVFTMEVQ